MDKKTGKIIFGPVPSRRLGRSLGVDILPLKTCNLNCIYCELGPTKKYKEYPQESISPREIEDSLRNFLKAPHQPFDIITITASGEPTLHGAMNEILKRLKHLSPTPLGLLTNSTMLYRDEVRDALKYVDVILPSLDAGCQQTFKKINRPAHGIEFAKIIEGLEALKKDFSGKIFLEVLFVRGINDSPSEVRALKKYIERIDPDEIQISTISRPPAEPWAKPLEDQALFEINKQFGPKARLITSFTGPEKKMDLIPTRQELLEILKRRPLNEDDIKALFSPHHNAVLSKLNELHQQGFIKKEIVQEKPFFVVRD